jgi:hypothetical protein
MAIADLEFPLSMIALFFHNCPQTFRQPHFGAIIQRLETFLQVFSKGWKDGRHFSNAWKLPLDFIWRHA